MDRNYKHLHFKRRMENDSSFDITQGNIVKEDE